MKVYLPVASDTDKRAGWSHDYQFIDYITQMARKIEDGISMEAVEAVLISLEAVTDELKPCPFCGASARLEIGEPHRHSIATFMKDARGYILISCSQCSAAVITDGQDIEQGKRAWNTRAESAQEAREELTIYRVALEDIADGSHPDQGFEYSQTKLREIAKEALGSSTSLATTVKKNDNRKKCAELLAALKECIYCSENFGKAYAGRDARDRAKALIRKYECDAIAGKEEVNP